MVVPPDLVPQTVQGTDSYLGAYRGPGLSVDFDYGWYANYSSYPPFSNEPSSKPGYEEVNAQIDGREARILKFFDPDAQANGQWLAALFVTVKVEQEEVGARDHQVPVHLSMWARGASRTEQDTAVTIFNSIQFPS